MNRFKPCSFHSTIIAAALIVAGCASQPKIHKGLTTTTPVTQNRDHVIYDWPPAMPPCSNIIARTNLRSFSSGIPFVIIGAANRWRPKRGL